MLNTAVKSDPSMLDEEPSEQDLVREAVEMILNGAAIGDPQPVARHTMRDACCVLMHHGGAVSVSVADLAGAVFAAAETAREPDVAWRRLNCDAHVAETEADFTEAGGSRLRANMTLILHGRRWRATTIVLRTIATPERRRNAAH